MKSLLGFVLALLLGIVNAGAQDNWELAKEKNDIRIYTRDVPHSNFKAVRGVTEIEAEVADVYAVLFEIGRYDRWMASVSSAEVMEKEENTCISYIVSDMPLMLSDRDGYYKHVFRYDNRMNTCLVTISAVPDYQEQKDGIVRIPEANGFWKLKGEGNGQLKLVYEMHSDPGGAVPSWLSSSGVINSAWKTIMGLKNYLFEKAERKDF